MVSYFPSGVWSYGQNGGFVAAPSWPQADVYAYMGVPVPAHPSPQFTGLNNVSYFLADTRDAQAEIAFNNQLTALSIDNTRGYTSNLVDMSQWYF